MQNKTKNTTTGVQPTTHVVPTLVAELQSFTFPNGKTIYFAEADAEELKTSLLNHYIRQSNSMEKETLLSERDFYKNAYESEKAKENTYTFSADSYETCVERETYEISLNQLRLNSFNLMTENGNPFLDLYIYLQELMNDCMDCSTGIIPNENEIAVKVANCTTVSHLLLQLSRATKKIA